MRIALFLILAAALGGTTQRAPTLERLTPERLQAVREAVESLAADRRPVTLRTGRLDLRCVIHAHSALSHDSRGSIEEIIAAAKQARVDAVFFSEHPRSDRDVAAEGHSGLKEGVLFVPGAETNGFLLYPGDGKLPDLKLPAQQLVDTVRETGGLVFVAHPEEERDWSLRGLTGMEVYNTHADFKDESELAEALQPKHAEGYLRLLRLLDNMGKYPREAFAALSDAPRENLAKYDRMAAKGPFAAIAGNDSHQNVGFILRGGEMGVFHVQDALGEPLGTLDSVKNPVLQSLFGKPMPGQVALKRILDPYPVSFGYVSTHVLARDQTTEGIKQALQEGRTYVAFDWLADPAGTVFLAESHAGSALPGACEPIERKPELRAEVPVPARLRIVRDGVVVAEREGRSISCAAETPGVYRMEASLRIAGEERPWIYTGAIRILRQTEE